MVARAVRSALGQSLPASELIVVDDASGDDTGTRAEALGARVIAHAENQGEGAARNTGLRAASHDWVALLDCDDEWLPSHLETLWRARANHVLVGSAALGSGPGPGSHRLYGWCSPRPRVLRQPTDAALPENRFTASTVLIDKPTALAVGGFPSAMKRAADLDLWMRMLEHGTALVVPEVTALYHLHGDQISSDRAPMRLAATEVLAAYADRPWCTPAVRRRLDGAVGWDNARARGGLRPLLTLAVRLASSPRRAVSVAQLLAGRFTARRAAGRLAPGGGPSIALLRGSCGEPPPTAIDLRSCGRLRAYAVLARRPTARALVPPGGARFLVRALGIEPVTTLRARR